MCTCTRYRVPFSCFFTCICCLRLNKMACICLMWYDPSLHIQQTSRNTTCRQYNSVFMSRENNANEYLFSSLNLQYWRMVPHYSRCPPRVHIIPYTLQHLPREDYVRCAWRTQRNSQHSRTNHHQFKIRWWHRWPGRQWTRTRTTRWAHWPNIKSLRHGDQCWKTKLMTINMNGIHKEIKASDQRLQTVTNFKYLGAIISDAGSKAEMLSRIAQCTTTMTRLKQIWNDKNITLRSKVRLMRTLIISILLYACETWALTIELQRRIKSVEIRCYRRLLHISYKDHITNEIVCKKMQAAIGPYKDILTTVEKGSYESSEMWSDQVASAKKVIQGTVPGKRKSGRQKKRWEDNIREWTGLDFNSSQRAAEDRQRWHKIVADVSSGAFTTLMVPGHR